MDLRHLRYFVAVAEELHFTRAAERLDISQPPLSRQIKQLEKQIGVPLFYRLSRGVELLAAGESFLIDTRNILSRLDSAVAAAESMARGQIGHLQVGFGGATYLPDLVPARIMRYRTLYPDVFLSPEQSNTPSLVHGLHKGHVNIAFIRPPVEDSEGLVIDVFFEEDMVVVLLLGHPLSREKSISLVDLSREIFILFPQEIGPKPSRHDRHGVHEVRLQPAVLHGLAGGRGAPVFIGYHTGRMYSGRPSSSMRFRTPTARATPVPRRRSVREPRCVPDQAPEPADVCLDQRAPMVA